MKDPRQFGAGKPATKAAGATAKEPSGPFDCSTVELWMTESSEQTLPAAISEQIQAHAAGCAVCREKLAQARRGREWLLVLKQESLEPPAGLMAKILARTSLAGDLGGAAGVSEKSVLDIVRGGERTEENRAFFRNTAGSKKDGSREDASYVPGESASSAKIPAWQHSSVVVLRRTFIEPRLVLVAAMAFFSIAVTLNLLGVRLTTMHAADLAPKNMHRAVTRQYAEVNARVVRYYENLRIVYEVEAQVQQLRRAAQTSTTPQPQTKPRKQSSDSNGDSNDGLEGSHRGPLADNPVSKGNKHATQPALLDPRPVVTGPRMDASLQWTQGYSLVDKTAHRVATSFVPYGFQPAPLALPCSFRTTCFSMRYFSTRERRLA